MSQVMLSSVPGFVATCGWVRDPEAVRQTMAHLAATQDISPVFSQAGAHLLASGDDDKPFMAWRAEEKVKGSIQPSWNQGSVGTCFPAGTRIRMADGSHKPIEQVKLNDVVLTAEGNTGRVRHLFARHESECLIRFKCHGHYGLAATPEHPILTKRGYVRLDRLRVGDYVAVPRYLPNTAKHIVTAGHRSWVTRLRSDRAASRSVTYNGAAQFGRKSVVVQVAPIPDTIEMTPSLGRILGLFLAEGSTDKNKVVWTFNAAEKDTLAAELVDLLAKEVGAQGHIQERGRAKTCRVNLHGRGWSELFESLCGNGAGLKRLHPDIASGPTAFLTALYDGWVAGDGHLKENSVQGTTVSRDLALSMFDVANALGRMPTIRFTDPKVSHGVKKRLRRYDVVVGTGGGKNRPPMDDKSLWRKVTSIVAEPYQGDVFNMEVEGDNSYVAEGIGCHNCVSFGWGRGSNDAIMLQAARGEIDWPGADVATEPIYAGSRVEVGGGRISGDGSVGAWAARWVKEWGVLLRKSYGSYDLSTYSESKSRDWGRRGCPDDLEPIAKQFPVKYVALVKTFAEAWTALGNEYLIPVCSGVGFDSPLVEGFCERRGGWSHCMVLRARVIAKRRGARLRALACQNSWGDYIKGEKFFIDGDGNQVQLPPGCFLIDEDDGDAILREEDSFAISDAQGWLKREPMCWVV